jgi:hypothetical protein
MSPFDGDGRRTIGQHRTWHVVLQRSDRRAVTLLEPVFNASGERGPKHPPDLGEWWTRCTAAVSGPYLLESFGQMGAGVVAVSPSINQLGVMPPWLPVDRDTPHDLDLSAG